MNVTLEQLKVAKEHLPRFMKKNPYNGGIFSYHITLEDGIML